MIPIIPPIIIALLMLLGQQASANQPQQHIQGTASWYVYHPGQAAAGPDLRALIGQAWRGQTVRACRGTRCVEVVLTDWCACPDGRVIDLDVHDFARLTDPSRGLMEVRIEPASVG